jgi:hypothetical protein
MYRVKKVFSLSSILIFFVLLLPKNAHAAISSASDTISTSRPSAGTTLNVDHAANASYVTITDNGSLFLASDAAMIRPDTGETANNVSVASMSASVGGVRTVFFTAAAANKNHKGSAIVVPITATHTVRFTTGTGIVPGGHIVITFPALGGTDTVSSSPSARTFMFNGIATGQINWTNVTCSSVTTTAPAIDCTVNASGVAAGTQITATIGTSGNQRLINPTVSTDCIDAAPGSNCNADAWKVSIRTQDASAADVESTTIKIATIQSVLVQALVEPTITFTIEGLLTTDNYLTKAGAACGSEASNAGISTTSTSVNLGLLNSGGINHAGQLLTVSTNSSSGYSITATSSGRFINPASGQWLTDANTGNGLTANDTPAAAAIAGGTPAFGISPCGTDTSLSGTPDWGGGSNTVASGALFSNPWNTGTNAYYATIASYGGGASSRKTVVRYAATISPTTPAGIYSTVLTYVATATF